MTRLVHALRLAGGAILVVGCGSSGSAGASSNDAELGSGGHGGQGSGTSTSSSQSSSSTGPSTSSGTAAVGGTGGAASSSTGGGLGGGGFGGAGSTGGGSPSTSSGATGEQGCNFASFGMCEVLHDGSSTDPTFAANCSMEGGAAGLGCPTTDLVGSCDEKLLGKPATVYYYMNNANTLTVLQQICATHAGTWHDP